MHTWAGQKLKSTVEGGRSGSSDIGFWTDWLVIIIWLSFDLYLQLEKENAKTE